MTLTDQEHEASRSNGFDLSAGYATLAVSRRLARMYCDPTVNEAALATSRDARLRQQQQSALDFTVAQLLRLPPPSDARDRAIRVCLTGSIAINRTLAACRRVGQNRGLRAITVLTTSPSIDTFPEMVREHAAEIVYHENRTLSPMPTIDAEGFCETLALLGQRQRGRSQVVALIASPENPTGACWNANDLRLLSEAALAAGAIIVIDHAFLLGGPSGDVTARGWDCFHPASDWFAVWDTGKCFDAASEKLAVVISGHPALAAAIDQSLNVLQYDVPCRVQVLFERLLAGPYAEEALAELRTVSLANLQGLSQLAAKLGLSVLQPQAGTVALLDISSLRQRDESLRHRLLRDASVGVVAASCFFHTQWKPRHYLRIALARDPSYFTAALERMHDHLAKL